MSVWIGAITMVVAVAVGARGWAPLLAFGLGGFAGGAALRQVVQGPRAAALGMRFAERQRSDAGP